MFPAQSKRLLFSLFLFTAALGWFFSGRERAARPGSPAAGSDSVISLLRARELRLGESAVMGFSDEGSPGLWLEGKTGGKLQMGVHANGYPFLLLSDREIRNFGLGRVDGRNASPIVVFRSGDIVKLVFGLDMTGPGSEPFLAHWSANGTKNLLMGAYCDDPSRVCAQ